MGGGNVSDLPTADVVSATIQVSISLTFYSSNLQLKQNKQRILKTLYGSVHAKDEGTGYFARAISYEYKLYTKLTIGVYFISILHW